MRSLRRWLAGSLRERRRTGPRRADSRRPGLPPARDRLQGHHAAARGCAGASRGGRASSPSSPSRAARSSCSAPSPGASSSAARSPMRLGCGFATARKPGKLPWRTRQRRVRARVRHRLARGARGCDPPGHARARPRRRARHGRVRRARRSSSSSSSAASWSASRFSSSSVFLDGRRPARRPRRLLARRVSTDTLRVRTPYSLTVGTIRSHWRMVYDR